MTKIIVIGNEKGGCGKTTIAMHLIVSLLKLSFTVATFDLDSRQQSLSRYLENRRLANTKRETPLLLPTHFPVSRMGDEGESNPEKEKEFLIDSIASLNNTDFIVIDTPGSDSKVSRYAHTIADIVITPINDSFVDLDLIGHINVETNDSVKPGVYSALLWECKMKRAAQGLSEQEWFVVRNRLAILDAKNKQNMEKALSKLSKRFGFKIAPGFSDRVIFKELFLHGITLHDAMDDKGVKLNPSILAARKELRDFMIALNIDEINLRINNKNAA
jgi:chromosome partitioning protein